MDEFTEFITEEDIPTGDFRERLNMLAAQVQLLVDHLDDNGLLGDHCFTFPDGETVWATKTLEENTNKELPKPGGFDVV